MAYIELGVFTCEKLIFAVAKTQNRSFMGHLHDYDLLVKNAFLVVLFVDALCLSIKVPTILVPLKLLKAGLHFKTYLIYQ